MSIKVSIILPVYNVEEYLEDTFQALLNQSLKEIEIIAVNDGSTDRSEDIIGHYAEKDPRIRYIKQENKGQSAARNAGLRLAGGEYIYFMDSDDLIGQHAIEECYDRAKEMSSDICVFDADIIYEEGAKRIPWNYHQTQFLDKNRIYDGTAFLNTMIDNARYNSVVWLYLVRRDFLINTGILFYEGIIHEDELFTTSLFLRCDSICCLGKSLVRHRIRSKSTMGKRFSARNMNCYLTVMDELLRTCKSPFVIRYVRFTLPIVFHTGHVIPFRDKLKVFMRAAMSGYIKYIGMKSIAVFWLKRHS